MKTRKRLQRHARLVAKSTLQAKTALKARTPLRARTALTARTAPRRSGAHRKTPVRPYSFPAAARTLIDARDISQPDEVRCCQRCGSTRNLERHHRRGKASGGSQNRGHAHCPCCGVTLCALCHRWAHKHPVQAEAEGFVVSQAVDVPGTRGVMRFAAAGGGATQWPDCLGNWLDASVMGEEAA